MSAFKKAQKAKQRPHRERSQPASRQHLGILEKKKDYKVRARNFHNKEKQLKSLRKKALEKNPDEFYFKMVNKRLQEGEFWIDHERPEETMTEEQKKLMGSQDINYVRMKLQMERKKLEKLSEIVDLDKKPKNKRIIFVDSEKEANQVKLQEDVPTQVDEQILEKIKVEKEKVRKEIATRRKRENELRVIADKMTLQRHLADSSVKRVKEHKETKTSAAIYKWEKVRKR